MRFLLALFLLFPTLSFAQTPEEQVYDALNNDETVIVQWWTDWCVTCQKQKRTIDALKQTHDYSALTFIEVNFDEWGDSFMAAEQNVVRRSTLVALNKDGLIDVQVAQTDETIIKGFLDNAIMVENGLPPVDFSQNENYISLEKALSPQLSVTKPLDGETCTLC